MFQSVYFILFVIIVFCIYWKLPHKYRWAALLTAGYLFYTWCNAKYTCLLLAITLISYVTAIAIEKESGGKKKALVVLFTLFELGILVLFKYLGLFADMTERFLKLWGCSASVSVWKLVLPVGISFYIFQTLAYIYDVYAGKIPAEKHLGYLAASIAFFPILLSGPIVRVQELTKQLKSEKEFEYESGNQALQLILTGYFKKLIIADSLAVYVDKVYGDLESYAGFALVILVFFYAIEIYCDFSGYSDVAIGVAQLLGVKLTPNFRRPYLAASVQDFWRRWHISLTSWFRDYVYIPLGGNRVAAWKVNRNLLITFFLSGLWHGANWTFMIWGAMHGILQILEKTCKKHFHLALPKLFRQTGVFVLISIAWVFFRAETLGDAVYVLQNSFSGITSPGSYLYMGYMAIGMAKLQMLLLVLFIAMLARTEMLEERGCNKPAGIGKLVFWCELALIYYMKYGTDSSAFIYFQF